MRRLTNVFTSVAIVPSSGTVQSASEGDFYLTGFSGDFVSSQSDAVDEEKTNQITKWKQIRSVSSQSHTQSPDSCSRTRVMEYNHDDHKATT